MLMLKTSSRGFTIVELLIVIVVIAILAAITIVAYNGVISKTHESVAKNDLSQAVKKLKTIAIEGDELPSSAAALNMSSLGAQTVYYSKNNTTSPKSFCITMTVNNQTYHMNQDLGNLQAGPCAQHASPVTNLLPDPAATNTSSIGIGGTGTTTIEQDGTAQAGSTYLRKSFSGTTVPQASMAPYAPVTGGETYTFSCWVRNSAGRTMSPRITWYDAAGVAAGSISTGGIAASGANWNRASIGGTAPANAVEARLFFIPNSTFSAGSTLDFDSCMFTTGSTLHTYADGDTPDWSWTGAPNASTSVGPAL